MKILSYLNEIMKKIGFEPEAKNYFLDMYKGLDDDDLVFLSKLEEDYFLVNKEESMASEVNEAVYRSLKLFAERKRLDYKGLCMLFLLLCSKRLLGIYKLNKIDESVFYASMTDLKYKLDECKKMYGDFGTFVFKWYHGFYLMKRFALGRFQYETAEFRFDSYDNGVVKLRKGDPVYSFHIPSSGPVTKEKRIESFKRAYDFFNVKKGEYLILVCCSWLLYPENKLIFPKNSNLLDFFGDFDIIERFESDVRFADAWRVFNKTFDGNISCLPAETTLQKNYIRWLEAGNSVGEGYGVIVFDGEKIVRGNADSM